MEAYLGTVQLFALSFTPTGWLACDGTMLPIMQNQALYALLGITFGGDGQSTFALPDLRGKEPAPGLHYAVCAQGIFPSRP